MFWERISIDPCVVGVPNGFVFGFTVFLLVDFERRFVPLKFFSMGFAERSSDSRGSSRVAGVPKWIWPGVPVLFLGDFEMKFVPMKLFSMGFTERGFRFTSVLLEKIHWVVCYWGRKMDLESGP